MGPFQNILNYNSASKVHLQNIFPTSTKINRWNEITIAKCNCHR